ncbi:unnamed protein product [Rhodiola kirilowii]
MGDTSGLASRLPRPENLVKFGESYMYKASRKKKKALHY